MKTTIGKRKNQHKNERTQRNNGTTSSFRQEKANKRPAEEKTKENNHPFTQHNYYNNLINLLKRLNLLTLRGFSQINRNT